MSAKAKPVRTPAETAEVYIFTAVFEALKIADKDGIEFPDIQAAALEAADFLRTFGTPPKSPAPKPLPMLRIVRPPILQRRLPLDFRL